MIEDDLLAEQPEHKIGMLVHSLNSTMAELLLISQDPDYCKLLAFSGDELDLQRRALNYIVDYRIERYKKAVA